MPSDAKTPSETLEARHSQAVAEDAAAVPVSVAEAIPGLEKL